MKSVCVLSPGEIVLEERPTPVIEYPTEVLVKVKAGGICGSDMHVYHGSSPVATYPRVIGHEIAAEIIDKGNAVNNFSIGDRVVMDPVISCGDCYQCRIGRQNVCANLKVRSAHVDGGFQEYLVLPMGSIYHVPDHLSWEEASMVEPFTIAAQACSRGEVTKEDTVFIIGAGPIGLCVLKMAKLFGAKCIVSDVVQSRLKIALAYGADAMINKATTDVKNEILKLTDGIGATVVIDAACTVKSFEQAIICASAAGRIVTLGFNKEPSAINQFSITAKELDISGSRLHNKKFPEVIEYMRSGSLKVKEMITHTFHFTKIQDAINLIEDTNVEKQKVVLLFN